MILERGPLRRCSYLLRTTSIGVPLTPWVQSSTVATQTSQISEDSRCQHRAHSQAPPGDQRKHQDKDEKQWADYSKYPEERVWQGERTQNFKKFPEEGKLKPIEWVKQEDPECGLQESRELSLPGKVKRFQPLGPWIRQVAAAGSWEDLLEWELRRSVCAPPISLAYTYRTTSSLGLLLVQNPSPNPNQATKWYRCFRQEGDRCWESNAFLVSVLALEYSAFSSRSRLFLMDLPKQRLPSGIPSPKHTEPTIL